MIQKGLNYFQILTMHGHPGGTGPAQVPNLHVKEVCLPADLAPPILNRRARPGDVRRGPGKDIATDGGELSQELAGLRAEGQDLTVTILRLGLVPEFGFQIEMADLHFPRFRHARAFQEQEIEIDADLIGLGVQHMPKGVPYLRQ